MHRARASDRTASGPARRSPRPSRSALLVLGIGLILGFGDWACGALGLITPVLILRPLLVLGAIVLAMTLLVGWLGLAACRRRSLRVLSLDLLVLAMSTVAALYGPSLQQGFAWRISATPEADWLRLADDARQLARAAAADGELPRRSHFYGNRKFFPELARRHPFLNLSLDRPTKLFIAEDSVAIDWGGGMAGPMLVRIQAEPMIEAPRSDALYTTQRIHPRVSLTWE